MNMTNESAHGSLVGCHSRKVSRSPRTQVPDTWETRSCSCRTLSKVTPVSLPSHPTLG